MTFLEAVTTQKPFIAEGRDAICHYQGVGTGHVLYLGNDDGKETAWGYPYEVNLFMYPTK